MKNTEWKKIIAVILSACMVIIMSVPAMAAQSDREEFFSEVYAASVDEVVIEGGAVKSAAVTTTKAGEYSVYAAVYENGVLDAVTVETLTITESSQTSSTVTFSDNLTYNADSQVLKCYVWEEMTPVSEVYEEGTTEFKTTFEADSGVASIDVYYTQDYTAANETDVMEAIPRDSTTGEPSYGGEGQVNFKINLKEGYKIKSVEKSEKIKNMKSVGENIYRATKITGEAVITITTEETSGDDPGETGNDVIHLADNNTVALTSTGDNIDNVTVDNETNTVTITPTATGETYTIDGTLTDGQIIVTAGGKKYETTLVLNNVSVSCSTGSPLYVTEGKTIINTNNTNSTFTCTAEETASDGTTAQETAAVNTKRDTSIVGGGTVTATSQNGNAIHCKKDLVIGEVNVTATGGNNGIKGKQSVTISENAKNITVTAVKDGICSDYAPEIDEATNTLSASLTEMGADKGGSVTINGGTINVTTTGTEKTGDGIQADRLLQVTGGDITVNATGEALKANLSNLDYTSASDYSTYAAALAEYNGCVVISGGKVTATSGEDAIKAAKDVTVSDEADITVTQAGDDGIQAGDIVINETTPSSSQRIDGSVTVSGGTVDIKNASGDGISATLAYTQTDGTVTAVAAKDGVQSGKAYTYYDIHGSGDDNTVLYETNGVVNITGGALTITAGGGATKTITDSDGNTTLNGIDYSCKGIKSRKLIDISGGIININALDDALHSNHTMNISGGDIDAASCDDGVHGEYYLYISDNADINVTKSYEGIEASKIYISSGETRVNSTDDGANAAGDEPADSAITLDNVYSLSSVDIDPLSDTEDMQLMAGPGSQGGSGGWGGGPGGNDNSAAYGYIEVSGGLLYIVAEGDGFDSNGSALISGGTVLVNGPTSGGNGVFDIGDNNCTLYITGGTVVGAGTSDMAVYPNQTTNSQYFVYKTGVSGSAGKAFKLTNSSGSEVLTYIPEKTYQLIFICSPDISNGTYNLSYGGSAAGGSVYGSANGNYGIATGATYSGGSTSSLTAMTTASSSGGGFTPGGH